MTPKVSIVIRCKNEARDIGGVLRAIASQKTDIPYEVIVVDSGSTDGTLDIVCQFPVRLIEIPPQSFTFGYALNVGCKAARGDILLALSAHVYPRSDRWLDNHVRHFDDPKVVATCMSVDKLIHQDLRAFHAEPYGGFDNSNGGFRASCWRERPFDETMTGTEDKEWGYHFQKQGFVVVCDPALDVLHEHPVAGSRNLIRDRYIRAYREHVGFAQFLPRHVMWRALLGRFFRRPPRNRESIAWYVGACKGVWHGPGA